MRFHLDKSLGILLGSGRAEGRGEDCPPFGGGQCRMRTRESRKRARLRLSDGSCFEGWSFGASRDSQAELVFTTGMVGYPQSLTDPSFHGQILVATWPLVGNYGVPAKTRDAQGILAAFESERIWASGLVVGEACPSPSHHASRMGLSAWLESEGIPGIEGIDTRALTILLREKGCIPGRIEVEDSQGLRDEAPSVAAVSTRGARVYGEGGEPRIALLDCGVKNNILRRLLAGGARVEVLPWDHGLLGLEYDALLLSNGPGDPKACSRTIGTVRMALEGDRPIFGICLGAQILALAAGSDTYRLPYGHRGQNQPCVETGTGRCYITSQNHGYAVSRESLPAGWQASFTNGNDGTVEGISCQSGPFSAVQFHPEGCPGPTDTDWLLDSFLDQARSSAQARVPRRPA